MKKVRLDDLLVSRGDFDTRAEVVRAVIAHEVRVDDVYVTSAALRVLPTAEIFIRGRMRYVSRGGYKLAAALESFDVDVKGAHAIDVGSSTGGFTDCLLQAGAADVTCVDVNYGQLAWQLRDDARVRVFERLNIKAADPESIGAPFDIIVADLSFIGLASLSGVFARLSHTGTSFVGLIKPQFESQHDETESGVVTDVAVRARTVEEVCEALRAAGFRVEGTITSPITGKRKGNVEYLVHAVFESEE